MVHGVKKIKDYNELKSILDTIKRDYPFMNLDETIQVFYTIIVSYDLYTLFMGRDWDDIICCDDRYDKFERSYTEWKHIYF